MTLKQIQAHRSHTIDGVMVSFKRRFDGWLAIYGPDRDVHFREVEGRWVARRPGALEPLCVQPTLEAAVRMVGRRYAREDRETADRVTARLRAALAERRP